MSSRKHRLLEVLALALSVGTLDACTAASGSPQNAAPASTAAPRVSARPAPERWLTVRADDLSAPENEAFTYDGAWKHLTLSHDPKSEKAMRSNHAGDSAKLHFVGTRARVFGVCGRSGGYAVVTLDGSVQGQRLDFYAPAHHNAVLLYETPTLAYGPHDLVMQVSGLANSASKGDFIALQDARVQVSAQAQRT